MDPPSSRGRGRGRSSRPDAETSSSARYERLSLLTVELEGGAVEDGADSALLSEDDRASNVSEREDYQESSESDDEGDKKRKDEERKKKHDQTMNYAAQAAAFGSSSRLFGDDASETGSVRSRTSSKRKRDAYKECFPVKGISCVGGCLSNRTGPVEVFVTTNCGRMSEASLWKLAALTWKREVVEPAKREGVQIVDWPWKQLATHFKCHTVNQAVGRTNMINTLTAMRMQMESRMVRVEGEERELDKQNADLVLKILAAESRERTLLAASSGGRGGARGQRPAGEE